jgi:hypothetical protein
MNPSTLQHYSTMKEELLKSFITKEKAAELLGMHPNSVSRLKRRYVLHGARVLVHAPPGPCGGTAPNRTPDE